VIRATLQQLLSAWWPAVSLVLFSYALLPFDVYERWPSLDVPMHALGGFLVAYAMNDHLRSLPGHLYTGTRIVQGVFVLSLTTVITVAWETFELVQDDLFGMASQLGIRDAIAGIWIGLLGALLFVWIEQVVRARNR